MPASASVTSNPPPPLCLALALATACAGDIRDDSGFGSSFGSAGDADGDGGSAGDDGTGGPGDPPGDPGSTGGDSGDDGGGVKFDTLEGEGNDGDGDGNGCEKVDFLFVIDNSGSMEDEQQNLAASFPGFITAIRDTLMAQDYHLMVVDTDEGGAAASYISCSPDCCAQSCIEQPNAICNGVPCGGPQDPCDITLGAGKVKNPAGDSCQLATSARYMTDLQPNLGATFSCAAKVGTSGDGNERPVEAMLASVSPDLGSAGSCNEGFLRNDAVLVATLISDEEDAMKSAGTPQTWHDALVAAKGGNEDAVVMLGLVGDTDLPGAVCQPYDSGGNGAEPAPALRTLVESFPKGVWGSVCAPDYAPFFLDAVSVIDAACDEFDPVG